MTKQVYQFSESGRFGKDFGLKDQMRRASVSIMSNIAEGFESKTNAMFLEYLGRAKASAGELRSQLYVGSDVNYLDKDQFLQLHDLISKCTRQISAFMKYLQSSKIRSRI